MPSYTPPPETHGRTLAQSATSVSLTGTTDETTLASYTLPAGFVRTGGRIEVYTLWSMTGSTNAKTKRVKIGSTAFMAVATTSGTTVALGRLTTLFARSRTSQLAILASAPSGAGAQSSANTTGTEDLDTSLTLAITGQLASSGETLTLEAYSITIFNGT